MDLSIAAYEESTLFLIYNIESNSKDIKSALQIKNTK